MSFSRSLIINGPKMVKDLDPWTSPWRAQKRSRSASATQTRFSIDSGTSFGSLLHPFALDDLLAPSGSLLAPLGSLLLTSGLHFLTFDISRHHFGYFSEFSKNDELYQASSLDGDAQEAAVAWCL